MLRACVWLAKAVAWRSLKMTTAIGEHRESCNCDEFYYHQISIIIVHALIIAKHACADHAGVWWVTGAYTSYFIL